MRQKTSSHRLQKSLTISKFAVGGQLSAVTFAPGSSFAERKEVTEKSDYTRQPQRLDNVAGVCNEKVNVFGLMLHPERASESILGSADGRVIFESTLAAVPVK